MKKTCCYVLFSCILWACKKEANYQPTSIASEESLNATVNIAINEHKVLPAETDANIKTQTIGNASQYGYVPKAALRRKDKLLVFIPGTWATPSAYNDVCQQAAYNGYYSFAVAYSNLAPIEWEAGSTVNDKTVENILEEFLTGNNTSPKVNVSKANSFENRITKMILNMQQKFPGENWKRFLNNDSTLKWQKISIAGHSQGSDHAMYISKKRSVLRATFYAGPGSFKLANGSFPSFMITPGLTPSAKLYGFNHTADDTRRWNDVKEVWTVLGLTGTPDNIDDGIAPGAHQLITSLAMPDTHSGIIQDDPTPLDSAGIPLYASVWKYASFP